MSGARAYCAAALFDGARLHRGGALVVAGGQVRAVVAQADLPGDVPRVMLEGGILAPGFVDLQVNGGGGVMFNDDPAPETLARIARAHAGLGATTILPTLITDTPDKVRAAIAAVADALAQGMAGIAGLHLEGPHLSQERKGAHDPALIRPMREADLELLLAAARRLPVLMVTLAPESVTPEQVQALARGGVLVALGHTDADFETCSAYFRAGARLATHLFNAMSPLGARAPGLVGAALQTGAVSAGLIADAVHVHPAAMAIALRAKQGPGGLFLVSDAMAPAGTDLDAFTLNGRRVWRRGGRLTLEDGTLAGADLDLATALSVLTGKVGLAAGPALAMATARPAALIGAGQAGRLAPGSRADFVHLGDDMALRAVWQGGQRLEGAAGAR